LALESHRRIALDWIVVGEEARNVAPQDVNAINAFPAIRALEEWDQIRRTKLVRLCAASYRDLLRPFLRHAKRLDVVDPYLRPTSAKFVELCAVLMGDRGHEPISGKIRLHVSERELRLPIEAALDEWATYLSDIRSRINSRHTFQVVVWGPKDDGETFMHDRFLLTNQFGVKSGNSFSCWKDSTLKETDWTLLDDQSWNQRRNDYVRDSGPFRWIDEREV
jgi:hypothetical protein